MATKSIIAFSLLFLALFAVCNCQNQTVDPGSGSCVPCDCHAAKQRAEDEARRPTIFSSSLFQNASSDLILQCNPAPGCDAYSSELIFSNNNTVLYNSTLKRENGVTRINATAIRFPSLNVHLSNLTCAYNSSLSSNSLDIPYLNIDEFQINPIQLKLNQTSTVSCKVALKQEPKIYTVRFLFNRAPHFEFKHTNGGIFWFNLANSEFRSQFELKRAGHFVVSEYPVYSAIFAIEVTNIGYNHYSGRYGSGYNPLSPIQCELQYGDNELMTVRSNQISMSF